MRTDNMNTPNKDSDLFLGFVVLFLWVPLGIVALSAHINWLQIVCLFHAFLTFCVFITAACRNNK